MGAGPPASEWTQNPARGFVICVRYLAEDAKRFVSDWFRMNPAVKVKTTKDDKYGRILGKVFALGNEESLNSLMVRLGYAWEYDGNSKTTDVSVLKAKRGL